MKGGVSDIVMAVIVLTGVLLAFGTLLTSLKLSEPVALTPEANTLMNQIIREGNTLGNTTSSAYETIQNISIDNPVTFIIGGQAILGVLSTILGAIPAVLGSIVVGFIKFLNLPGWLSQFVLMFISAYIVLNVIGWLSGRRRP